MEAGDQTESGNRVETRQDVPVRGHARDQTEVGDQMEAGKLETGGQI